MTYVYMGSFFVIIQPTPAKFRGHKERWSAITTVALGFLIFVLVAECLSKLQAASRIAGLPRDDLLHPYFRQRCSVTIKTTPSIFGVSTCIVI